MDNQQMLLSILEDEEKRIIALEIETEMLKADVAREYTRLKRLKNAILNRKEY